MRILGIDPGYAIVGWGVLDYIGNKFSVVDFGSIQTSADMDFNDRLLTIYDELDSIIKRTKPQCLSIEKIFYNSNAKTAINVSQARGVLLLCSIKNNLDIFEYTPLQVKQSVVGYGRAEKKQIQEMTKIILNLRQIPKPDDTADALAMAICHAHSFGSLIFKGKIK